jgi:hypothetical protein
MTQQHDEQANSSANEEWEKGQAARSGQSESSKLILNAKQIEILERMAEIGCTLKEMTYILGVCKDPDTLTKSYGDVIEMGRAKGNWKLRYTQYQKACEGSERLLIWLGKVRLGQREDAPLEDEDNMVLPWTD